MCPYIHLLLVLWGIFKGKFSFTNTRKYEYRHTCMCVWVFYEMLRKSVKCLVTLLSNCWDEHRRTAFLLQFCLLPIPSLPCTVLSKIHFFALTDPWSLRWLRKDPGNAANAHHLYQTDNRDTHCTPKGSGGDSIMQCNPHNICTYNL